MKKSKAYLAKQRKLLDEIANEGKATHVALDVAVCPKCKKRTLHVLGELGKPGKVAFAYRCRSCGSTEAPKAT